MPERAAEPREYVDPYRRAETFETIAEHLKLALKQLASRTVGGFPCWCNAPPILAASEQELPIHEPRCEAVTKAWIRAGHAGIGSGDPAPPPTVLQE